MLKEASGHVAHTLEATVTAKPSGRVILDLALIAAGLLEVIGPPVALAGIAVNRLVYVAK